MLNIYANNYPQEKIHLQLDKKIYKAGETVWFKAYIFSGADPSLLSRNFYAELSDPSGKILERKVYPVRNEFVPHASQFVADTAELFARIIHPELGGKTGR